MKRTQYSSYIHVHRMFCEWQKQGFRSRVLTSEEWHSRQERLRLTKAVSVDESDIAAFKKLHEMGIELEIRPVATDKKVDLMSKIEGIEG